MRHSQRWEHAALLCLGILYGRNRGRIWDQDRLAFNPGAEVETGARWNLCEMGKPPNMEHQAEVLRYAMCATCRWEA